FFQAEDGIRDRNVTGVQTCALPISLEKKYQQLYLRFLFDQLPINTLPSRDAFGATLKYIYTHPNLSIDDYQAVSSYLGLDYQARSEERRVGKELRLRLGSWILRVE